ncbi:MAG: hypothetical protein JXR48_10810 [Candidatus Delongbacteria bacterium]|nr:hypothetical protein [Candidatus Delongbacteria bacterium]MBN2835443.1 hypothetical protein [Candidatus Delongbacteria bacterium]
MKYLAVLFLIFMIGCNEKNQKQVLESSNFLNYLPREIVPSEDTFQIILEKDLPIDETMDISEVFTIDRDIKHELSMDNQKSFTVKLSGLDYGNLYIYKFDLSKIKSDKYVYSGKIESNIYMPENRITVDARYDYNDDKMCEFKVDLSFRYSLPNAELLRKYVQISPENLNPYTIEKNEDGNYVITSEKFKPFNGEIFLKIDKGIGGIKRGVERSFPISLGTVLSVVSAYPSKIGNENCIEVRFDKPVSDKQDLNGFIKIDDKDNIKYRVVNGNLNILSNPKMGQVYNITLLSGIKDVFGNELAENYNSSVRMNNQVPEIRFLSNGVILPSYNEGKIAFEAVNVKKVRYELWRLYENNINYFLFDNKLTRGKKNNDFPWRLNALGDKITEKEIKLKAELNTKEIVELNVINDLKDVKGVFFVRVSFQKEDLLYDKNEFAGQIVNPDNYEFMWKNGSIIKSVIFTDLAMSTKRIDGGYEVFVNNMITSRPESGVNLELIDNKNQIVAESKTDATGTAIIKTDKYIRLFKLTKGSESVSYSLDGNMLNREVFDISGQAFSGQGKFNGYFDRGVYRPGEKINLTIISAEKPKFGDMPVTLKLYNPSNQLYKEDVVKIGTGLTNFEIDISSGSPVGNYRAEVDYNSERNNFYIPIEFVVPNTIRVENKVTKNSDNVDLELKAEFLNSEPFVDGQFELEISALPVSREFKDFRSYRFDSPDNYFSSPEPITIKDNLDENGYFTKSIANPFKKITSDLRIISKASVFQKNGKSVDKISSESDYKSQFYIGVSTPFYNSLDYGENMEYSFILVDKDGKPVIDREIEITYLRNDYNWWYSLEYDRTEFKRYLSNKSTRIYKTDYVKSTDKPLKSEFSMNDWGQTIVRVKDVNSGVANYIFFETGWYGGSDRVVDAEILTVSTDKQTYKIGDEITVNIVTPDTSTIVFSCEKDKKVLSRKVINQTKTQQYKIAVTEEMFPNFYLSTVSYVPYSNKNSRPERMISILPIKVRKTIEKKEPLITIPDSIEPMKDYELKIDTGTSEETDFVVAIVDEGLLNLTDYASPTPEYFFYAKRMHDIQYYDTYADIIGSYNGIINRKYAAGGGMYDEASEENRKNPETKFKPVAIFSGVLKTDDKGIGSFKFKLPEYIGSVRIITWGRSDNFFFNSDKDVNVDMPVSMIAETPLYIGGDEEIYCPATIFIKDKSLKANLAIKGDNLLTPMTTKVENISANQTIMIPLKSGLNEGMSKVVFTVTSGNENYKTEKKILVRSSLPVNSEKIMQIIDKNVKQEFLKSDLATKDYRHDVITVGNNPLAGLTSFLQDLIEYPHGCLEQTISRTYAQMLAKRFFNINSVAGNKISIGIEEGLQRLQIFHIGNGQFALWEYGYFSPWTTLYAYEFMVYAKSKGYVFQHYLIDKAENALLDYANNNTSSMDVTLGILYNLAGTKHNVLGRLNYIRETSYSTLTTYQRYLLAGGLKKSGIDISGFKDLDQGATYRDYYYYYGDYGQVTIDAMIAKISWEMGYKEMALERAQNLLDIIKTQRWLSTYSTAKVLSTLELIFGESREGEFMVDYNGDELKSDNGKIVINNISEKSSLENISEGRLFTSRFTAWKPKVKEYDQAENRNIAVKISMVDMEKHTIKPENLKTNSFITINYTIDNLTSKYLNQLALTQLLPPSLRVLNPVIDSITNPEEGSSGYDKLNILDDRFNLYFNIAPKARNEYKVIFNVQYAGNCYLPPVVVENMYSAGDFSKFGGKDIKVSSGK